MKKMSSLQATRPSSCCYLRSLWKTVIHHVIIHCIGWRFFSLHRLLQKTNQWHEYFHPCYIPVGLQIQYWMIHYPHHGHDLCFQSSENIKSIVLPQQQSVPRFCHCELPLPLSILLNLILWLSRLFPKRNLFPHKASAENNPANRL